MPLKFIHPWLWLNPCVEAHCCISLDDCKFDYKELSWLGISYPPTILCNWCPQFSVLSVACSNICSTKCSTAEWNWIWLRLVIILQWCALTNNIWRFVRADWIIYLWAFFLGLSSLKGCHSSTGPLVDLQLTKQSSRYNEVRPIWMKLLSCHALAATDLTTAIPA